MVMIADRGMDLAWAGDGAADEAGLSFLSSHEGRPCAIAHRDNVAYVEFSTGDSARHVALDDATIIDYAADGSVVGVEFISPSRCVNLAGVPRAAEIEREVRRLRLPIRPAPAAVARP